MTPLLSLPLVRTALAFLVLATVITAARSRVVRWFTVLGYRFLTGRVLTRPRGRWDARYLTRAPEVPEQLLLVPEDRPVTRWARLPGWQRQVTRLVTTGVLVLAAWRPRPVEVGLVVITVVLVTCWWWRRRVRRLHREAWDLLVEPLAERLGWGPTSPSRWLHLPRGSWSWEPVPVTARWRENGPRWWRVTALWLTTGTTRRRVAEDAGFTPRPRLWWPRWSAPPGLTDPEATVAVTYPRRFDDSDDRIADVARLAAGRLPGTWQHRVKRRELRLELYHEARWPSTVAVNASTFAEHPLVEVPYGVDRAGRVQVIPLKAKTPHVSCSAATGWGKTTFANLVSGHLLYHGAYVVVLDPKLVGYSHYAGLPNVEIHTVERGMIQAIRRVKEEMNRRYELIVRYNPRALELGMPSMKENPELYFRPLVLLEDEKGSFTVWIKAWWKRPAAEDWELDYKEDEGRPGRGDPLPLLDEQEVLWRGRAAAVHLVTMAQQNNLFVFLNSDMRDQYGFRILLGPQTASSWRMTFPGVKQHRVGNVKGRAVAGIGAEDNHTVQVGVITDVEARTAAEHGTGVAGRLDEERTERLSRVSGKPPGEVSSVARWMVGQPSPGGYKGGYEQGDTRGDTSPLPGKMPEFVSRDTGTTATASPHLRVIHGDGTGGPPTGHPSPLAVVDDEEDGEEDEYDSPPWEVDRVTTLGEAARFLGMNVHTFRTYRQRDRRVGITIPTEEVNDEGRPSWTPLGLEEWRRQHHPER